MRLKWSGVTLAVVGLIGTVTFGQTEKKIVDRVVTVDKVDGKEINLQFVVDDEDVSSHWIGVTGTPVDGLLKKHLKIDSGVVISFVSEESPASKAGLQVDDIILSVNGQGVENIQTVAKMVSESGDKSLKFVVLREGDDKQIKVTPEKRPDGLVVRPLGSHISASDIKSLNQWIDSKVVGPDALKRMTILRLMPGGIVDSDVVRVLEGFRKSEGEVKGKSMSIAITQTDGKAKITINQDGKATTVTEDNLDDLPKEVREHVKRLLAEPNADLKGVIGKAFPDARLEIVRRGTAETVEKSGKHQVRIRQAKPGKAPGNEVEEYHRKIDAQVAEQLKHVQKQLEEMRKEIRSLRNKK